MDEKVIVKPMADWFKRITGRTAESGYLNGETRSPVTTVELLTQNRLKPDTQEISYSSPDNHVINHVPGDILKSIEGVGNPEIREELQIVLPVSQYLSMPELLDVFQQYPQYTFFPVID
ncbi:hypothetical protein KJ966_10060 [bacterium]|nr:hypothetical protein [bacterium]